MYEPWSFMAVPSSHEQYVENIRFQKWETLLGNRVIAHPQALLFRLRSSDKSLGFLRHLLQNLDASQFKVQEEMGHLKELLKILFIYVVHSRQE